MSLDLLKERLNINHPVSETEIELEHNRKLVEELQNESINLKNQILSDEKYLILNSKKINPGG